ncbi:hypothetical protein [Streptomyces sp. CBMA152]|uniref:hypothetical protein n=1 Tax=Streptomyces sp. CBMA152 TaxID=1896312 RepID=UPI001660C68E|nr:hypothetical protein [Streptomyces sp. CBMA152]MBD0748129.1 hypothetical protein [Streptomyces sp. CBMA152]
MRRGRAALLFPALLLVAGCGIRSTDVVEVGDPAFAKVAPAGPDGTTLYFKGPNGLLPVVRAEARVPGHAVMLLLNGPTEAEKDAGLDTELPHYYGGLGIGKDGASMTIRMERAVLDFSALAREQLVCTASHTVSPDEHVTVTVMGNDGKLGPASCPF